MVVVQQKNGNNNSRLSSSSTPLSFFSRAATLSSVRLRRVFTSWTRTWLDSTLDWSSENDIGLVIKSAVGTVAMVAVKKVGMIFFLFRLMKDASGMVGSRWAKRF